MDRIEIKLDKKLKIKTRIKKLETAELKSDQVKRKAFLTGLEIMEK